MSVLPPNDLLFLLTESLSENPSLLTMRLLAVLLLLVVLPCLTVAVSSAADYDEDNDSSRLMYLLKRRDMPPPFELPSSMIQQMLKYRRY